MAERHPTLQVVALPGARLYIASRFFGGFARSLVAAMLSYHVYERTGSYAALGILGLVEFAPVIPIALLGGAIADSWDRRRLLLGAQTAVLAGTLGLAGASHAGADSRLVLFGSAFWLAAVSALANPAAAALLPTLVPREIFANATVLASTLRQLAFISGPIAMGFLIEPFGFAAPYALAGVCYAVGIACLLALRTRRVEGEGAPVSWASVREGIGFVFQRPPILGSMTLDMFAVIFAGATAMLPVYAEEILQVGPVGYGLLRSAMGMGTLLMTTFLLFGRSFDRPGRALLIAVAVFGIATIAFGLSRVFPLSLAAFVAAGMADQVSMTARSVILQLSTPDALRGRVNAVNMIFIGASNELGDAESGFLAALTSATFSVVAGGVACLAALGVVAWRVPSLRDYRVD